MFDKLNYVFTWIGRWRHTRGFGVQSPSAYQFIRYVVNEHYPYYSYEELTEKHPRMSFLERHLFEFYFRLSNYRRPHVVVDFCAHDNSFFESYLHAGCRRSQLQTLNVSDYLAQGVGTTMKEQGNNDQLDCAMELVFVPSENASKAFLDRLVEDTDEHTVLVVEGIYVSRKATKCWKNMVADQRTGVTFDLYYCGVVFFDKRIKQHYLVNF